MIIDDDIELTDIRAVFLRNEGHTVVTSDTADGAIEKLLVSKPDLLILDVMFPENSIAGFELARKIRKVHELEGLPIIMMTGVNDYVPMDLPTGDPEHDCMPVQDFIDKPVELKELLSRINQLLNLPSKPESNAVAAP